MNIRRLLGIEPDAVKILAGILFVTCQVSMAAEVVLFVGDTAYDTDDQPEIHLVDSGGKTHRRVLTKFPFSNATLDPTGTTIAYLRADKPELRSISVDGRRDRLLTRTAKRDRIGLAWSPNGRYIAFGHKNIFAIFSAVSVFDVRLNRIVAVHELPRNHTLGATTHAVIDIDWSSNTQYMTVMEKVILFLGISVRTEYHTTIIDTRDGEAVHFGQHKNYGFLNNKQYIVKTDSGDIGLVNVATGKVSTLINLGPSHQISDIVRHPRSKRLFVVVENIKQNFEQGLTGLTRLRGTSRQEELGYDLMQVDLRARIARLVTPPMESFFAKFQDDRQLIWRSGASAQVFKTHSCWGWVVTKMGTKRNDRILGTSYPDVIYGGAGNDYIDGRGGGDVICGGPGHDRLHGKKGNDVIFGDMALNRFDELQPGFPGRDRITGGDGSDFVHGEGGNDIVRGGKGNDVVVGGPGNDSLAGQQGDDNAIGGPGTDKCVEFERASECE